MFGFALGPRWVARDTYVTADEDNWVRRAGGFAWGVANGRPGRTYQNGHPGVLTMELAILGQGPGGAERFGDPVTGNPRVATAVPGFFEGLVDARRAFAIATAGMVAAMAMTAGRLFGPAPAAIGGALVAFDPFYLAHSQLVHLDAVLSGCMSLAALSALLRWGGTGGRGWVVLGGVFSGLGLLAKLPAVYLAFSLPLLALILGRDRQTVRSKLVDLVIWGTAALATFVVLWPSMWVNPLTTLTRMMEFARETGGQPHEQGSYFLGQQVVDPGPLFYLVSTPLRLSPATTLGLLALAGVAWQARASLTPHHWRAVAALVAWLVGFTLFMTLGAKKFDRYLLPIFPVLDLLAGLGWWGLWRTIQRGGWSSLSLLRGRSGHFAAGGALLLLSIWPAASVFPYYLTYYNPIFGGAAAAAKAIPVGEGEGLAEVARWLNARPNSTSLQVASHSFDALKANFLGGGETLRDRVPPSADYVVLYNYQVQIGRSLGPIVEYGSRTPEYVVRLNGLDYARVYRGPHRSDSSHQSGSG